MDNRRTVLSRLARQKAVIDELISQTRDRVRCTMALLRAPAPDIFLGRKRQEPLSEENDSEAACEK